MRGAWGAVSARTPAWAHAGGGRAGSSGGVARDVLLRLRERHPDVFRSVRYRAVEVSPELAERQAATVAAGGADLSARFAALVGDATLPETWAGAGGADARGEECHVFGLEVLDNLPHDLVRRGPGGAWEEALVAPRASSPAAAAAPAAAAVAGGAGWEEVWQPLQDPLVERCLRSFPWGEAAGGSFVDRALRLFLEGALGPAPAGGRVFLPTGCLQLLETLCAVRPRHRLLLAAVTSEPGLPGVTVSIGLTDWRRDDTSIDDLFNRADRALYAAKDAGRNNAKYC